MNEVTGAEAGLSGDDQIRIALAQMLRQGGRARTADLYGALESVLRPRGLALSQQGRDSLRFFVNRVAVRAGYVHPHDPKDPGWRITDRGREVMESDARTEPVIDVDSGTEQQVPSNSARGDAFELYVIELMRVAYPYYAWTHQGRDKRNERGLDFIGRRIGDAREEHRSIAVQVKFHRPGNAPTEREWLKFLAGCFARRVDGAIFITSGRLTSEQRREAQEANVTVIEGREELRRLAALHELGQFELFGDEGEAVADLTER
jgi:Restriction endonuclease